MCPYPDLNNNAVSSRHPARTRVCVSTRI